MEQLIWNSTKCFLWQHCAELFSPIVCLSVKNLSFECVIYRFIPFGVFVRVQLSSIEMFNLITAGVKSDLDCVSVFAFLRFNFGTISCEIEYRDFSSAVVFLFEKYHCLLIVLAMPQRFCWLFSGRIQQWIFFPATMVETGRLVLIHSWVPAWSGGTGRLEAEENAASLLNSKLSLQKEWGGDRDWQKR